MRTIPQYLSEIKAGNHRSLARALSIVENELPGNKNLLEALVINPDIPVIGITGPPGSGKSTLLNAVLKELTAKQYKIAVLAVDPTSPFSLGSLLGDRVRMQEHFNNSLVYIRSIAARGAVGGLCEKIIEMTDVLRSADFDYIFIETLGVGQSEIEVAGIADLTLVVLIPEAGDEIQHIKAGLMEIGDAFIVNKSDRPGAAAFASRLNKILHIRPIQVPVFQTIADQGHGIQALSDWVQKRDIQKNIKRLTLYTEKAFRLIQHQRMQDVSRLKLRSHLEDALQNPEFNLYRFINYYI